MKKILMILGGIFSIILIAALSFFGYSAYVGNQYDASSKSYIEKTLPTILQADAASELVKYASPQLVEVLDTKKGDIDFIFKKLTELGKFDKLTDLKGDALISITTQSGRIITARYESKAIFEKGQISIVINLINNAGQWQISRFHVNL